MAKVQSPLLGYNTNVRHKGRVFHIQTEDSGVARPHVITHLFADGGRVVKSLKTSYADLVGSDDLQTQVKKLMQDQHKSMFVALRDGQFDAQFEPAPEAAPQVTAPPVATAAEPVSAPQPAPIETPAPAVEAAVVPEAAAVGVVPAVPPPAIPSSMPSSDMIAAVALDAPPRVTASSRSSEVIPVLPPLDAPLIAPMGRQVEEIPDSLVATLRQADEFAHPEGPKPAPTLIDLVPVHGPDASDDDEIEIDESQFIDTPEGDDFSERPTSVAPPPVTSAAPAPPRNAGPWVTPVRSHPITTPRVPTPVTSLPGAARVPLRPPVAAAAAPPARAPSLASPRASVTPPAPRAQGFGERLVSERSLDEVILAYLAEELDDGRRR